MKYIFYSTFFTFIIFFIGTSIYSNDYKVQEIALFCLIILSVGGALYLFDKYIYTKVKQKLIDHSHWGKLFIVDILIIFIFSIIVFLIMVWNNPDEFYEKLIIVSCLTIWGSIIQIGRNLKERRDYLQNKSNNFN